MSNNTTSSCPPPKELLSEPIDYLPLLIWLFNALILVVTWAKTTKHILYIYPFVTVFTAGYLCFVPPRPQELPIAWYILWMDATLILFFWAFSWCMFRAGWFVLPEFEKKDQEEKEKEKEGEAQEEEMDHEKEGRDREEGDYEKEENEEKSTGEMV